MASHNQLGKWGEQVAREHLLQQGYAISGENVRIGGVEIDFIAQRDGRVCFVEVKTRSKDYADPVTAVDLRKQARMARAADTWLRMTESRLEPQFDIILVIGTPETGHTVEHIPDAFFPALGTVR